ncbi:right-handed parallel beta-helix repeat-containing protein [Candidatus Binatus sp.]|uniref:right-handed parallel beta-helix repeat-containing protein n=2 Tax=Candidatus Binatus sp. TaxID=2811406 RepID=UPI003CC55A60
MPRDRKIKAAIWLSGTLLVLATLAYVINTLAKSPSESPNAYYVDSSTGDDFGSGHSPSNPWRTIGKVNSVALAPGDTVYFRRGEVWRETLEPRNGGALGHPVTFTAYGSGPAPTISGSDIVTGWSSIGASIFRARSSKPNNVYVDGGPGWGLTRACCLPGESCTRSDLCAMGPMTAGSWYWNPATSDLYVWLQNGSNPANHVVEAAVRIYGMNATADEGEKGNIVIDGLAFERTGGYGIYFYSNAENGQGPVGVVIRNNTVRQTGTGQVDGGEYYNAIHFDEHLELNTAPRFIGNTIAYSGGHGNAINSQKADGAQIIGNHAEHFNHNGFDTKQSTSVLVRGNTAHDASEANGIYQEYCANGIIENNVIYNISGSVPGRGSGIQIDAGTSGATIIGNSISNVLTGIYLITPATARDNVVSHAGHAVLEANAGGTFEHNQWGDSPIFYVNGRRETLADGGVLPPR